MSLVPVVTVYDFHVTVYLTVQFGLRSKYGAQALEISSLTGEAERVHISVIRFSHKERVLSHAQGWQYIQQVIVVFFGDFLERFGQGLIV